ncbi:leukocyte receptor cluster member 1 homolog [Maniola hyperantus]|uniref:leukocyte receptor cluster member 1 homolog n=1 Tax=Aphantopus hyperantus TaxID=2795564 RepID=UPI00156A2BB0|nr:leukocyte receptor cluster member 1 homolog [Maniola hyperantus]
MNILPKKRWHVRTKENIARVRKDEAEAAEKERQEKIRIDRAEREARLSTLKNKSKQKLIDLDLHPQTSEKVYKAPEHINFFSDLEHAVQSTNKEHDKEFKDKKEEYEKKIGYLTYLGQDTNEALGKKNWYEVPPGLARFSRPGDVKDTYEKLILRDADGIPKEKTLDVKNDEIAWKVKQRLDPLNTFKHYCNKSKIEKDGKLKQEDYVKITADIKKKHKNKSKHKDGDESKNNLQKLREARLKREQQEKYKTEMFLSKLSGVKPESSKQDNPKKIQPKYNSQFNPELARQNYR